MRSTRGGSLVAAHACHVDLCSQGGFRISNPGVRVHSHILTPVVGCWDTAETLYSRRIDSWTVGRAFRNDGHDRLLVQAQDGHHHTTDGGEAEGLHNRGWCRMEPVDMVPDR